MVNKDREIALKEILNGWWNAGAQSRQAEIDELKKRIDEAMEILEYNEYVDSSLQALDILKGQNHD